MKQIVVTRASERWYCEDYQYSVVENEVQCERFHLMVLTLKHHVVPCSFVP
jgi:hypothetical protein